MTFDILIIGSGITGSLLAYKLSKYAINVAVVDKENDIANGATMANSAIVHTGYDPEPGTLKAKLNVLGAKQYKQICKNLSCNYQVKGAYVVATNNEEEKYLETLEKRAIERNIPYEWLSGDEARNNEKYLNDSITKVLSFPTTAVIYPWEVAINAISVAINNGVKLFLNNEVKSIEKTDNGYIVKTNEQQFETKYVIDAAGVHGDDIAKMVNDNPGFEIKPRRGEYYVLDQDVHYVDHIIFPVPSKSKGKGVLAVPTVYGNTLIGPNSDYVDDKDDNGNSFEGLAYVQENINKTMKNVPIRKSIRTFAGLRPSSLSSKDFIIKEDDLNKHFIYATCIESPGLASAPAIADEIIDIIKKEFTLKEKENADMTYKSSIVMANLTHDEQEKIIRENPLYGKIICRCEMISEGEIVACVHRTCGATTIKGVKKRVRPGMGRCQGGFCEPLILNILARELNKSPIEIVLDSKDSKILDKENR